MAFLLKSLNHSFLLLILRQTKPTLLFKKVPKPLSGSTELGKNVVMGGQSASAGHLKIGDFATIAARGAAVKDMQGGQIYGGAPAMPQRDWLRLQAKFALALKKKN